MRVGVSLKKTLRPCLATRVLMIPTNQIAGSIGPFGKEKRKTRSQKAAGHNPAALDDKFRLGSHQPGTNLNHPSWSGQADADAPCVAQTSHEITIGNWIGRSEI